VPLYDPGVSYRGALEVNRGAFDRWGISNGDRLRITSRLESFDKEDG
jgi:hypothetical protein